MRTVLSARTCARQLAHRLVIRPLPSRRLVTSARGDGRRLDGSRELSYAAAADAAPTGNYDPPRHPPAEPRYFNFRLSQPLAASLALIVGGTAVGVWFPPDLAVAYHPPSPPKTKIARREPDSPAALLERSLATLPAVLALRQDAFDRREGDLWRESRHDPINGPAGTIGNTNLLASSLYGPEKIAIQPLIRERVDATEEIVVVHVGNNLCGHDGIVHGGLVSTLFDQYMYRLGVRSLHAKMAVTAQLSVDYRAPIHANQFLVLKARREEDSLKSHKVWVNGRLEDANGKLLAEARAVFVTPKDKQAFSKPTAASAAPP